MVPPEIPARRGGWSCWTVGLLSCLGAVALLVAGLAILFIYVARRPEFKQAMSAGVQMAQCQQNMIDVYQAIERYRQRNGGQYPKGLDELTPRYLAEAGKLKCPADLTDKPVSYRYFKPTKDSPETAPLLQCDHHKMMNQSVPIVVLKNGQALSSSARVRWGENQPAPAPSGQSGR